MKVSVIIPVYHAAPFLDKSIQSAIDQKQIGDVLYINHRSTDGSLEICNKLEGKDCQVKVFVNKNIKGAGVARNIGLRNASYECVAFWMQMTTPWKRDLKRLKCFSNEQRFILQKPINNSI